MSELIEKLERRVARIDAQIKDAESIMFIAQARLVRGGDVEYLTDDEYEHAIEQLSIAAIGVGKLRMHRDTTEYEIDRLIALEEVAV